MLFISMMVMINIIFMFMFHPLAMIFMLILQTLEISLMIFYWTQFQWFAYTLILVFLGGMLILFMYMANIASNEIFKPKLTILLPLLGLCLLNYFLQSDPFNYKVEKSVSELDNFFNLMILKPYTSSVIPVTLLMALYILMTLLVVVKISKMNQGPLRTS